MRVLYCTDTYPPQVNGVSVVTALSAAGLTRRGWECAIIAPRYPAETLAGWEAPDEHVAAIASLPSVAIPGYAEVRLAVAGGREVAETVRRFRPDLVHCETEFSIGRMGQRAAAAAGVPLVSSYHTDFGRYAQAYGFAWLRPAVTGYLRRFHRRSRRVYTPSAVAKGELAALGLDDVEVWGRGVDTRVFHPARRSQELRERLGMGSRFTFVYVGRLAPEKRVDVVLDAFRQATAQVPRGVIHLVVAGTGPSEAELRAAAPPEVTFLGLLDRRDALPDLYANCDAFVFASVTETLGLVVLEAMASGLPVIAAPEGGVRDHLRDGANGLAYGAGDSAAMARAMVLLVGEWELSRRLARQARRTAEGLSWESELDRLDASYRDVVAGPPASLQSVGKDARDRRAAAPLALGVHPAPVRLDEMLHDGEA
jgi:phosphatidylinositol alpha 1,6-mannosyltransferase